MSKPPPFQPFDPEAPVHKHRENLPHWRQWETTYFVTCRLADALPAEVIERWRVRRDAWLEQKGASQPADLANADRRAYEKQFTAAFHQLLDAGSGSCLLADSVSSGLLEKRLLAGHGTAYHLDAWCIMPNHLHGLVTPAKGSVLGEILRHWKGGSARDINRRLGRRGSVWQAESFDHIVRSEAQLQHFRRYIAENPIKAGLAGGFVLGRAGIGGLTQAGVMAEESAPK